MSVYQAFASDAEFTSCTFDSKVYCGTTNHTKVKNHKYVNCTFSLFAIEGWGDADTTKDFFKNFLFDNCTSTDIFIYYQSNVGANFYLRDFTINKCKCLVGENGTSPTQTFIAINIQKSLNLSIKDCNFKNATLNITCDSTLKVNDNIFDGTDNKAIVLKGSASDLGSATFLDFTGNTIRNGGNAAIADSVVYIENWTKARVDNTIRCNSTPYGYKFTNNYAIEFGAGLVYDFTSAKFTETSTTAFTHLYR
jgi:hypothetical protein